MKSVNCLHWLVLSTTWHCLESPVNTVPLGNSLDQAALWTSLWETVLILLTDKGWPVHCWWHPSIEGVLKCEQEGKASRPALFLSAPDCGYDVTSCFKLQPWFPHDNGSSLELWAKWTLSPLKAVWSGYLLQQQRMKWECCLSSLPTSYLTSHSPSLCLAPQLPKVLPSPGPLHTCSSNLEDDPWDLTWLAPDFFTSLLKCHPPSETIPRKGTNPTSESLLFWAHICTVCTWEISDHVLCFVYCLSHPVTMED